MNDEKLIRRIVHKSDKAAADELIGRYYDEIYRYAYRQSVNMPDPKNTAQDLTQEIFISMLRSLHTFNSKKAGFRTWLYQVASSRIIDFRRKFRPDEVQIDNADLSSEQDFAVELQNQELINKIEGYISNLPSDVQRVFRLYLYGDMTFAQIAAAMDFPESTVNMMYKKRRTVLETAYL